MKIKATNNMRADANYFINLYGGNPKAVVTQGYLRLEASIQGGALNAINFNVLANQGATNVTEKRLLIPDAFHITKMFLGIFKAGTTTTASQSDIAKSIVRTFPNPTVFAAAGEADNLMNFYNGKYSIKVNQTTYIDNDEIRRFYRVGQSQQGQGPAVVMPRDEFSAPDFGFYDTLPTIRLSGSDNNQIFCTLPDSISMAGTASTNYAVCILRGFYVQNGAKFNPGL